MEKESFDHAHSKQNHQVSKPAPGLYLIATPIGNLADITLRALEMLKSSDVIVCEDTRVTQKLLSYYGIRNQMFIYNDHSSNKERGEIIEKIKSGEVIAMVSDAGTPLISDPGYKLVREVRERGLPVFTVPGPSAVISALSISGLPSDRFMFCGFLAPKSAARKKQLDEIKSIKATLVFYETASRLPAVLEDMEEVFGADRKAVIARELTKKFEEVKGAPVGELVRELNPENLRGEIVLLVEPAEDVEVSEADLDIEINKMLKDNTVKDIADILHKEFGGSRKRIYERALELKNAKKS